jgi:hypothetical protein
MRGFTYMAWCLHGCPSLAQMAAVIGLNRYHFARQFKAATGLPPPQYVIVRRVERAKELLQGGAAVSLAELALARRLLRSEPVHPPLQAPSRRHPRAVPDTLKNRIKARKSCQETGRQGLYYSLKTGAQVLPAT